MPRRASSSIHPGIIGIAVVVLVLLIVGGKMLVGKKSSGFGSLPPLDITQMLENANSMRGNEYVVDGQVNEKLLWTPDRGQFISLRVETPGGEEVIGVEIPPEFDMFNIETRQKYSIRVRIRDGGIPVATGITRL
ncbi:MAG: hypothetical protein ACNA8L_11145 [Luteolibacter sp.]|jgi:hypothetical protein